MFHAKNKSGNSLVRVLVVLLQKPLMTSSNPILPCNHSRSNDKCHLLNTYCVPSTAANAVQL